VAELHDQTVDTILDLLACPCDKHGSLTKNGEQLVSSCCGSIFYIQDGIPVLLIAGETNNG
jgi:hypothetical protein